MPGNPPSKRRIAFVSTMAGSPWGGSEVLWHGTALRMLEAGYEVSASVFKWPETPRQIAELEAAGCSLHFRRKKKNAIGRLLDRRFQRSAGIGITAADLKWLRTFSPELVVVSQGYPLDGLKWMNACRKLGIAYATVVQAAGELWWPFDPMAEEMISAYPNATAACFVSRGNREVVERQLGMTLANAHVICNPWNRSVDGAVPWPGHDDHVDFACVGRLDPRAKGQDVIFRVLAMEKWRGRNVRLNLYGHGPCEQSLKRLAAMYGLHNIRFHGRVDDIKTLWSENHALVLPSRYEGLPLVIVEAMLCARPVITTDIAGNAEYLTEGETGFIAAAPEPGLLDEAMERAWNARGRWMEMGQRARNDVLGILPADPYAAFGNTVLRTLPGAKLL